MICCKNVVNVVSLFSKLQICNTNKCKTNNYVRAHKI